MDCILASEDITPEALEILEREAQANPCWRACGVIPGTEDYFAINQFMFTGGILRGPLADMSSYEHRWCYETTVHAMQALIEWRERGWEGEPEGWHRHSPSWRRRPHGDKMKEYVSS